MRKFRLSTAACFLYFILLFVFLKPHPVYSSSLTFQNPQKEIVELFEQAMVLARKKQQKQARDICLSILEKTPDYYEVRAFLGHLYFWAQEYKAARDAFQMVLDAKPDYRDTWIAMINNEYYSGNSKSAASFCDRGLKIFPDDQEILTKKVLALIMQGNFPAATTTVKHLLSINPSHAYAQQLYDDIRYTTKYFELSPRYRLDGVRRDGGDILSWHLVSLQLLTKVSLGKFIGRINYTRRNFPGGFEVGKQFELDAYPSFHKNFYAYLNAGFSWDSIFPKYRLGGEVYINLPKGYEFSLGARHFAFPDNKVSVFTGSLGKYYKDYWFTLRPYLVSKSSNLTLTGVLTIRRFIDKNDYLGIQIGMGSSPLDFLFLEEFERVNSLVIGLEIKKKITRSISMNGFLRVEWEEFLKDRFGTRYIFELIFAKRFF